MLIKKFICEECKKEIKIEHKESHKIFHRNEEEVSRKNAVFDFEKWNVKRNEKYTPEFIQELENWKSSIKQSLLSEKIGGSSI